MLTIVLILNILSFMFIFILSIRSEWIFKRILKKQKEGIVSISNYIGNLENRFKKSITSGDTNEVVKAEDWIVITSFNRAVLTKNLINNIKVFEPDIKIFVVDNGSSSETINILTELKKEKTIDFLLLNEHSLIKQWQKSYSITQAVKILELRNIDTITISDDDIDVTKSWLKISKSILAEFTNIKLINLMDDDKQEVNHSTLRVEPFQDTIFKVKQTFNGAFFCIEFKNLLYLGYPPIEEGISDSSVEDWYYSRLFKANNWEVAALSFQNHLAYISSEREKEQKKEENRHK